MTCMSLSPMMERTVKYLKTSINNNISLKPSILFQLILKNIKNIFFLGEVQEWFRNANVISH